MGIRQLRVQGLNGRICCVGFTAEHIGNKTKKKTIRQRKTYQRGDLVKKMEHRAITPSACLIYANSNSTFGANMGQ